MAGTKLSSHGGHTLVTLINNAPVYFTH